MKILFAGGGTGGHFYPIVAVIEEIDRLSKERKLVPPRLYYMAEDNYDQRALFEHEVQFERIQAGKLRRYFSLKNFFDFLKIGLGLIKAIYRMFVIYPDVVFGKGGYMSFPALFAARLLRIPIVIHESDSVPGRVNQWAGKFADRIAVSYPEAASYFPSDKTALVGNPVRKNIAKRPAEETYRFLGLNPNLPVILVLGGSQGARLINDAIVESLPKLLEKYQIIHQTGKTNLADVSGRAGVVVEEETSKKRYRMFDFLNEEALSRAVGVASLIISRAGSTIFEIASWGIPSIIVPITDSNGDHQRKNAYNYARAGACIVIEEINLNPHILVFEIDRLLENRERMAKMSAAALGFAKPEAATKIAEELLSITLSHEKK